MAYIDSQDPNSEDENQSQVDQALNPQNAQQSQPSPEQTPSSGGGGVAAGGNVGNSSTPTASTPKPSSSGSWTNLDSYLNANADQGAKMGNSIAGSVNSQATNAQNDVGNLNNDFNSQVQANTVNSDDDAVNSAISAAQSGNLSADQTSAFQKQANANYAGPTDPTANQYYSQANNDVNNATQAVQQTQSEAGRDVLLQNQYQNASQNGYNQGENNLDQLLLENSQGGQQALQPLAQQWSGLTSLLGDSVTKDQQAAQAAQAIDQATAQNAQGALGTANTNFQSNLDKEVQDAGTQGQANYNDYQTNLANNNYALDAQTLAAMGLQPGARTFNLDLQSYLNPFSASGVSAQTVASPQEYAEYQALNQLAGTTPSELINPSLAGTAPKAGFNTTQLQSDITAKQNAYNTAYASQQGGVLNTGYLAAYGLNPNSSGGYADSIPGALTGRRDINTATPQDLESFWLPLFQQASAMYGNPLYTAAASGIKQSLDSWKNNQGWNNVISAVTPSSGN